MAREERATRRAVIRRVGFVLLWLLCQPALTQELAGRVVSVHDGDTVKVLDANRVQRTIRLAGIDAPELGQPFGRASRNRLRDRLAGQSVVVDWRKHDRYGRTVGTIWIGGEDANLEQLRAGLAWHYKRYQNEQPRDERAAYAQAEAQAQAARLGLWREAHPVPPWDYRKARKSAHITSRHE